MDWTWILVAGSMVGAVLNALGRRSSFLVWVMADIWWAYDACLNEDLPQAVVWLFFTVFSAWGYIYWGSKGIGRSK